MVSLYLPQDILKDIWWIGLIGFTVSLVMTPVVRFVAYRAKIVDRPDNLFLKLGMVIPHPHGKKSSECTDGQKESPESQGQEQQWQT